MIHKFPDKKTAPGVGASVNDKLGQELHKPVIKKFKRTKIYVNII